MIRIDLSRVGNSSRLTKRTTGEATTASMCHRPEPCRQLVDQRHVQDRSQSHDLVIGGGHTANQLQLCAQEFGDLQTYLAHARLTHLPFPAPTIRASRHDQLVRQPRRNRQDSRNRHEREPGVHQEGRSGRRGATTSKATPTNLKAELSRTGEPADRRQWWPSPKADGKLEQKSPNKIMLKAILETRQTMRDLSSTGQFPDQKQTQTYAEKVRQEERGHTRGTPFVCGATFWLVSPLSTCSSGILTESDSLCGGLSSRSCGGSWH